MSFQLLLLSPPAHSAVELNALPALFAAGLTRFHVRKPGWTAAELEAYLRAVPAASHARLVLHSNYELARRYAVGGVHLTERARQDPRTARLLRQLPGRSVSASLHSLAAVARHRRRYDYVFLSPVFDSISKVDYASTVPLPAARALLQRLAARPGYRPRVLALGGIDEQNVGLVRQAGFAGAAVLGHVWQHPDPVAAFRQLQGALARE